MKRRTFIRMVGASALGLPFMYSQFKAGPGNAMAEAADNRRTPFDLAFSPEEQGVISVLRRRSKAVCLVGGGILCKAGGDTLPYVNLLTDSAQFSALKNDLFTFGVQPISTPELPSHFIKFVYGEKPYTVLNMGLGAFLKQNALGPHLRLLPLAHNFLVYSTDESWVVDPYGALQSRAGTQGRFRIKRLLDPASAVAGMELCLAVAFDAALLQLTPPSGHSSFEGRVLASQVASEQEATSVFHQILSFFPDLLELRGLDMTRKYLTSPLCLSAAALGPGIDLMAVDVSLGELGRRGSEVSSTQLLTAINQEFGRLEKTSGLGVGFPDYMAAKKLAVRRGDLLAETLRAKVTERA